MWRNRIAATHTFRAVALQWFDDGLFHLADHAIHFKKHRLFCYWRSVHPANIRSDLGANPRSARFQATSLGEAAKDAYDVGNVGRSCRGADHICNRRL